MFLNLFQFVTPLVFTHNLWHPSCSFINTYDILTIVITTKMHFYKNATNYHNIITTKMHFIIFKFKRPLNFTNIFSLTVNFATMVNFEICG